MVKIEYFETANNLKHNISGVNMTKVSKKDRKKHIHRVKGLKSIEFETMSYPDMKIERVDFSDKKEEAVNIDMNFTFEVSKKEFFEIVAALRQSDSLWFEECFPMKVKMETCIDNPEKFYWLYAKMLKKKEEYSKQQ